MPENKTYTTQTEPETPFKTPDKLKAFEYGSMILITVLAIAALISTRAKKTIKEEEEPNIETIGNEEKTNIQQIKTRLKEKGLLIYGLEDDLLEKGVETNDSDVFELFKLLNMQAVKRVASIHIDKNLSLKEAFKSIYDQMSNKPAPPIVDINLIKALLKAKYGCLAITVDPELDKEIIKRDGCVTQRHHNPEIADFQNCVRGLEEAGIPVCVYSENRKAIPVEIKINLKFVGAKRLS